MGRKKFAAGAIVVAASIGARALACKHRRKQKHDHDHEYGQAYEWEEFQDLRARNAGNRRGPQASGPRKGREHYGADYYRSTEREILYERDLSYKQPHYAKGYYPESDGLKYAKYQPESDPDESPISSSRSSVAHEHAQSTLSSYHATDMYAEPFAGPVAVSQDLVPYRSVSPSSVVSSPVHQAQYTWTWDVKKKKRYVDTHDGQHRVYEDGERHRIKPLPPPEVTPGPEFRFEEYNGLCYWPNEAEKCWIFEDGTRQAFS